MATTPLPIHQTIPTNHAFFPDFLRVEVDGSERLYTLPDSSQTPWLLDDLTLAPGGIPPLSDGLISTARSFGDIEQNNYADHTIIAEVWWNLARADGSLGPDAGFHHLVSGLSLYVAGVTPFIGFTDVAPDPLLFVHLTALVYELYGTEGASTLTLLDSGTVPERLGLIVPEEYTVSHGTDAGILIRITATFTLSPLTDTHGHDPEALQVMEAYPIVARDIPDPSCVLPGKPVPTGSVACSDIANQKATAVLTWEDVVIGTLPIHYEVRYRFLIVGMDTLVATIPSGVGQATIPDLTPNQLYLFTVVAVNACGETLSDFVEITPSCPPVNTPPPMGPWMECAITEGPGVWTVVGNPT
jgi:hypothetical protein